MASSNKSAISAVILAINLVFFAGASTTTPTCPLLSLGPLASCGLPMISLGSPCCNCFNGLTDLEAAVCLCAAIEAKVLGLVNADINTSISVILGNCNRGRPSGFTCA